MKYFISIILLTIAIKITYAQEQPNVIIIFTDDQGYQDLGCYGSPKIKTPHIDLLAQQGIQFTDFYVSASVCSPSRASLLTGRYSFRNGVGGVFFPDAKGMNTEEITIAEVLKTAGYNTACFGKWHLGDNKANLPLAQGFDAYYGIPYSNDMYIGSKMEFATDVKFREGYDLAKAQCDQAFIATHKSKRQEIKEKGIKELCPLFEGNKIVEYPCEQSSLTQRYFDRAIQFIDKSENTPFFIYLTPAMPHVPLFASSQFKGKSERGLYGDVIEEIDWHTGQLIQHLEKKGIEKNTIIIYTSDNGPWLGYKENAGTALPLRDGKFSNYEGGVRVPCIMSWPGQWESGKISHSIASTLDLLPTIAHYAKAKLPNRTIDGNNLAQHLENTHQPISNNIILYTKGKNIAGIRQGDWKYLPNSGARHAKEDSPAELYNLKDDISESTNLIESHPEKALELKNKLAKIEQNKTKK